MSNVTIDLRQNSQTEILIDAGVIDVISWSGLSQLDSGYTLVLNAGAANEQSYTVGSGLTLDSGTNSVMWNLDTNVLSTGVHYGVLTSNSKVSGIYFNMNIKLVIE